MLKSVDTLTRDEVEHEYSHLVQVLENRSHNVQGTAVRFETVFHEKVSTKTLDEIYQLPICLGNDKLLFSDYLSWG